MIGLFPTPPVINARALKEKIEANAKRNSADVPENLGRRDACRIFGEVVMVCSEFKRCTMTPGLVVERSLHQPLPLQRG
jgi:hypothetical protein